MARAGLAVPIGSRTITTVAVGGEAGGLVQPRHGDRISGQIQRIEFIPEIIDVTSAPDQKSIPRGVRNATAPVADDGNAARAALDIRVCGAHGLHLGIWILIPPQRRWNSSTAGH